MGREEEVEGEDGREWKGREGRKRKGKKRTGGREVEGGGIIIIIYFYTPGSIDP